jgi:hypothetical protein
VCWGAVHAPPYIVKEIGLQVNKIRLIAGLHGDISMSGGATLRPPLDQRNCGGKT